MQQRREEAHPHPTPVCFPFLCQGKEVWWHLALATSLWLQECAFKVPAERARSGAQKKASAQGNGAYEGEPWH